MTKRSGSVLAAFIALVIVGGLAFAFRGDLRDAMMAAAKPTLPAAVPYVPPASTPAAPSPSAPVPVPAPTPTAKPPVAAGAASAQANLAVPFTSQAPHADWSQPYEDACEEASLVMTNAYFSGKTSLTADQADAGILDVVAWENKTFGYYKDTTAVEVARIAKEKFGLQATVVPLSSIDEAKRAVASGAVVLLPSSGVDLHNPNFRSPGPPYHMLVMKGYLKDGRIITNDPGTRNGANYLYDPNVLFAAVHDWNGGDVEHGAKVMIVITK